LKASVTILAIFINGLLISAFAQTLKLHIQVDLLPEIADAFYGQDISITTFGTSSGTKKIKVPGEFVIDSLSNDTITLVLRSYWKYKSYKKEFTIITEKVLDLKDTISFLRITFPQECDFNKHALNNKCPSCLKSDKVISILYGHRNPMYDKDGNILDLDPKEYYLGEGQLSNCSPSWYCKRDKLKF
jgi:hypothetical protein